MLPVCLLFSIYVQAQNRSVFGTVFEKNNGKETPLTGVIVSVPGYSIGTQTDGDGTYRLQVPNEAKKIVFQYQGFVNDTIKLGKGPQNVSTILKTLEQLDEVVVGYRRKGNEINMLDARKSESIGEQELLKAACCNLSESFETTPSVDVAFTDAVSGYKQIQMLGLAGPYTLITRENIPDVRGLSSVTGLTFTPGTWIAGMQLSKGTGSVVNGYESVAGQINVELQKPFEEKQERVNLNLYQNIQGRTEANVIYNQKLNKRLSTNLFLHGNSRWRKNDMNHDGFMDRPLNKQFIGLNRWFYFGPKGLETQFGIKVTDLTQTGGQLNFDRGVEQVSGNPWGYQMNIQRYEGWAKIGKVFPNKPGTSMGLQLAGVHHKQNALYGTRNYDATQNMFYANYIFQTIINNTNHKIKTGASALIDNYDEQFEQKYFSRNEVVPGAFIEYGYNYLDKFNAIIGVRGDYHNLFGAFITPRIHIRYAPKERTVFRASAGRAQRTANILAENVGYMASNRQFLISGNNPNTPYGLNQEVAWNTGVNFTQKFRLNYRDGTFTTDYYYTWFQNQVVVDVEDPRYVRFYNLNGPSYAHSFQAQLDYEPLRRLDVRLAYRWYDVKTLYGSILKQRPFVSEHRAFLNLGYETKNTWRFDYTVQWIGSKRVPMITDGTGMGNYIASAQSPSYVLMNAQVSKTWNDVIEIYAGGENLTNYLQPSPIIAANNPFGNDFDASMIWGPVMGRNIYAGLRWKFK